MFLCWFNLDCEYQCSWLPGKNRFGPTGTILLCLKAVAVCCIIVTWWSGPGRIEDDQLASFSASALLLGTSNLWTPSPEMTCNVPSWTFKPLFTQSVRWMSIVSLSYFGLSLVAMATPLKIQTAYLNSPTPITLFFTGKKFSISCTEVKSLAILAKFGCHGNSPLLSWKLR